MFWVHHGYPRLNYSVISGINKDSDFCGNTKCCDGTMVSFYLCCPLITGCWMLFEVASAVYCSTTIETSFCCIFQASLFNHQNVVYMFRNLSFISAQITCPSRNSRLFWRTCKFAIKSRLYSTLSQCVGGETCLT